MVSSRFGGECAVKQRGIGGFRKYVKVGTESASTGAALFIPGNWYNFFYSSSDVSGVSADGRTSITTWVNGVYLVLHLRSSLFDSLNKTLFLSVIKTGFSLRLTCMFIGYEGSVFFASRNRRVEIFNFGLTNKIGDRRFLGLLGTSGGCIYFFLPDDLDFRWFSGLH